MTAVILAIQWRSLSQLFAGLVGVLIFLALLRSVGAWWMLRRKGTPLPLRTYLSLRWRGIPVGPIAAAHWVSVKLGYEVPLGVWISFAMLRVDVVKLAAALAAAHKCNIDTSVGPLGAAAMAGYNPLDVVAAARDRGLDSFTSEHLNQLGEWELARNDSPA